MTAVSEEVVAFLLLNPAMHTVAEVVLQQTATVKPVHQIPVQNRVQNQMVAQELKPVTHQELAMEAVYKMIPVVENPQEGLLVAEESPMEKSAAWIVPRGLSAITVRSVKLNSIVLKEQSV